VLVVIVDCLSLGIILEISSHLRRKLEIGPRSEVFSISNLGFLSRTTHQKQAIANLSRECHCQQNLKLFSEDRKFVLSDVILFTDDVNSFGGKSISTNLLISSFGVKVVLCV
jgi:hypothetical protein